VVITGSRRLALRRLGASPEQVESSRPRVWVSITGHEQQDRIGFGDDAAAAGGLIARDEIGPVFVGDAIADPLAGLFAAVAATACLRAGGSWRVEVNLAHAAGYAACGPSEVFGHVGADGSRGIPSTGVITNS
jgi:crotonobetainyl-CoA:carnitine CoA-transferase CaiB-like acyl-CoA transferase